MLRVIPLLFLLFASTGCSITGMRPVDGIQYAAAPGQAQLVFVRDTRFGGAIRFVIVDAAGGYVATTGAKMHGVVSIPPGEYMFYALSENTDPVHVTAEAERTYIIQTRVRMGVGRARVTAAPVRRGTDAFEDAPGWVRRTRAYVPVHAEGERWTSRHAVNIGRSIQEANAAWQSQSEEWRQQHTMGPEDGYTAAELAAAGL